MACFLVPTTEAVVTTMIGRHLKSKEQAEALKMTPESARLGDAAQERVPFSKKLSWLSNLLWGGALLLAFEHVWHGEVVPWFPFLTAASNPRDAAVMIHEMSTVGVSMAILVTAVWGVMVAVSDAIEKRPASAAAVK